METRKNQYGTKLDAEIVRLFLLHMDAYSWNKSSHRLETALLYLLELDTPEDHQVKEIYLEVAIRTRCSYLAAERSLRYAVRKIWESYPDECSELFYRSSVRCACPPVSMFFMLFYAANERDSIKKWIESIESRSLSIYAIPYLNLFYSLK